MTTQKKTQKNSAFSPNNNDPYNKNSSYDCNQLKNDPRTNSDTIGNTKNLTEENDKHRPHASYRSKKTAF